MQGFASVSVYFVQLVNKFDACLLATVQYADS